MTYLNIFISTLLISAQWTAIAMETPQPSPSSSPSVQTETQTIASIPFDQKWLDEEVILARLERRLLLDRIYKQDSEATQLQAPQDLFEEEQEQKEEDEKKFKALSEQYRLKGYQGLVPAKAFRSMVGYVDLRFMAILQNPNTSFQSHAALGSTIYDLNPIIERMLEDAKPGSRFLDVGCSFGYNTDRLVRKGAIVFANDTDAYSLQILANSPVVQDEKQNKVFLFLGKFPEEYNVGKEAYDGILMSYVIHYFTPAQIKASLQRSMDLLKPGGKLYITALTPYSVTFNWFTQSSLEALKRGVEWPGQIGNPVNAYKQITGFYPSIKTSGMFASYIHPQYPSVLEREAKKAGFKVETSLYFPFKKIESQDLGDINPLLLYRVPKDAMGMILKKPETKKD